MFLYLIAYRQYYRQKLFRHRHHRNSMGDVRDKKITVSGGTSREATLEQRYKNSPLLWWNMGCATSFSKNGACLRHCFCHSLLFFDLHSFHLSVNWRKLKFGSILVSLFSSLSIGLLPLFTVTLSGVINNEISFISLFVIRKKQKLGHSEDLEVYKCSITVSSKKKTKVCTGAYVCIYIYIATQLL